MKQKNTVTILIVSKDLQEAAILSAELQLSGYSDAVCTASTISGAHELVAEQAFALAICHPSLGHQDIARLCNVLRQEQKLSILVLGAAEIAKQVGADHSLPFPCSFQVFLETLYRFVPPPQGLFTFNFEQQTGSHDTTHLYRDLFDRASDIILLMDLETHIIIDANRQAEIAYGYTRQELIGMSLLNIVPREQHLSLWENTSQMRKERLVLRIPNRTHIRQDGSSMMVTISASLIEYGQRWIFQDIVRDETERIRMEKELIQTNQRLKEITRQLKKVNAELDVFAYSVSHDLKAPLRGISQLATWIVDDYAETLDDEKKQMLYLLTDRAKQMHTLIDSVLEYSRVGRSREHACSIDLNQLVQNVIELLSPPSHIHVSIENKLPVIIGEPTRFIQLFQNLIDNALKYMDKSQGRVKIGCTYYETHWQFYVSDNGPGIDSAHHERIFRLFQAVTSQSGETGTGVGLALVKRIVETNGGRVWIESVVGQGSTFYFTLPQESAQARKVRNQS